MRIAISLVLLLGILASCHSEKLLVNNVSSMSMETDRNTVLNTGNSFEYTIHATLKSGENKKIKNDDLIYFPNHQLKDIGKHKAIIQQPLYDFKTDQYPITIGLQMEGYTTSCTDTLVLNFKGPIKALWPGRHGTDGTQPRASAATLFGRDGLEGKDGEAGRNGQDAPNFTGYLWEAENEIRMVLICDSTGTRYCYRTIERDSIIVDLRGGDAGNGSIGGTGGDGKQGKPGKPPGNGGDGGVGGDGGKGGNGGSLLLFIHPNATYMDHSIAVLNSGGKGGTAGMGGAPGNAGNALKGQREGSSGIQGKPGKDGADGKDGPAITISKVAFDCSIFTK